MVSSSAMHEIPKKVLISMPPVFGVDLSVTNEVILVWIAGLLTFGLVTLACRRGAVPHGRFQNLFDALMDLVDREIVRGALGSRGRRWSPFLMTLFFFILFANLIGLLPLPSLVKAMTSSLSVTGGLAGMVFLITIVVTVREHGFKGFVRRFLPSGAHPAVAALLVPIEIVSWLAKPVSLALRLVANMVAGHALLLVFVTLEMSASWIVRPLPVAGAALMHGLELFVCFIQAFVFTMLTGIYLRDAIEAH